jgi:predicted nucleic acid-binding protein
MNASYFLDTNIFVYSFDQDQPKKRERAAALIQAALCTGRGLISTQVIQAFLNVATRKFVVPMKPADSQAYLRQVLHPLWQLFPDVALYGAGLDLQAQTSYSFCEAMMIAAALRGECAALDSEDLHAGREIHGVTIVNPFEAAAGRPGRRH